LNQGVKTMTKQFHWGQALTALGLVGALAGCAAGFSGSKSASSLTKADPSKVGLATRAQAALAANDLASAVTLAESAVAYRPQDAAFRALLGNIYLASGRFASAEAAFHDSLSISTAQPQVILKLALAQIALGKGSDATQLLASAQSMLDATDLGLAYALAGRADQAVAVLEPAARAVGADARTRQNLALAYALGGDWQSARTIASQDLPADQLEPRMEQWLTLTKPGNSSSQIATFIGVTPAAIDPGQPTRLALNPNEGPTRVAQAAPAPAPAPSPVAELAPYVAPMAEPEVQVASAPVEAAPAAVAPVAVAVAAEAPQIAYVPAPRATKFRTPRPALTQAATRLTQSLPELRRAALVSNAKGNSRAVVQLGAYGSRNFIPAAWNRVSSKHGALKNFTPVIARFDSAKGTFYRLSVKGFASERQAIDLCASLKRAGGNCFVRATFNDAPVRMASR
jgi:Flp pilus assembly protein TadD